MQISQQLIIQFAMMLPVLLVSLVLHEMAHGWVAYRLGDATAKSRGRLSINPLRHLDRFGTLMLFLTFFLTSGSMLFGWAKPVPINPGYFKSPQKGMALVGLAGPASNFAMMAASVVVLRLFYPFASNHLIPNAILLVFKMNLILMLFNLIPLPPLDGSRIIGAFLNKQSYLKWVRLDQYGMIFIMMLFFFLVSFNGLGQVLQPLAHFFLPAWFY